MLTTMALGWAMACVVPGGGGTFDGAAAPTPVQEVEELRIASRALGGERTVRVALPAGYGESPEGHPVLLVLDGGALHAPAAAIADFLAGLLEIPRMMVVGIPHPSGHRTEELTPPSRNGWRPPLPPEEGPTGGGEALLAFLVDELLPRLDADYRTAPFRVLAGHSLGGLFTTWALERRPDAFSAGLTMDPSLWWNDRAHVDGLIRVLRERPEARGMRLVSVEAVGGFRDDWEAVEAAAGARPFGRRIQVEGESHQSLPIRGFREGLRALFPDHPPPPPVPGVDPVEALEAHYRALSERLGFTVPLPPAALEEAGRRAVEGNRLDAARSAAERLRRDGREEAAGALERALERAEASNLQDPQRFIPLVVPDDRPTALELAPFLGHWSGVRDHQRGVDSRVELTVERAGDSVVVRGTQTGPGGRAFPLRPTVLDVPEPGVIELGTPMRGGVGMEVATLRLVRDGARLRGEVEIRGFRIPSGARRDPVALTLDRVPSGGQDSRSEDGRRRGSPGSAADLREEGARPF